MGSCSSENKPEINSKKDDKKEKKKEVNFNKNKKSENKPISNNNVMNLNNNEIAIHSFIIIDDEFKDMDMWEEEIYVGEGIKKDRAYKSHLKIDEIIDKRKHFWERMYTIKYFDRAVIKNINTACLVDHGKKFYLNF